MQPNKFEIRIVEATTHYINIDCIESVTNEPFNLDGFKATFVLKHGDHKTYKETSIIDNTVTVKIDPEDTLGKKYIEFESRIFNEEKDVFHVCLGRIDVVEAVDPLTDIGDINKENQ